MPLKSLENIDIILASQAPWRSRILNQLRIMHRQLPHKYQEPEFNSGSLVRFIEQLACEKTLSLKEDWPEAMIIGADQLICLNDEIFYKSGTREKAIGQLERLNGRKHTLICAVAVWYDQKIECRHDVAELTMRSLDRVEIENYVELDKPWDCAGSYKIEGLGASLFKSIDVHDPTTIIGIPANQLLNILRSWGFSNLL